MLNHSVFRKWVPIRGRYVITGRTRCGIGKIRPVKTQKRYLQPGLQSGSSWQFSDDKESRPFYLSAASPSLLIAAIRTSGSSDAFPATFCKTNLLLWREGLSLLIAAIRTSGFSDAFPVTFSKTNLLLWWEGSS